MAELEDVLFQDRPDLLERSSSKGSYVMIPCPYHGGGMERTPSMSVARDKPTFFCHGCKEGGHIRKLLRDLGETSTTLIDLRVASLGYGEDYVPQADANVYTTHRSKRSGTRDPFRGEFILSEDVLDPYREIPNSLMKEGFSRETLYHFEVGWDPRELRITFPIRNLYGELVGVSGRTMVNAPEKYRVYDSELTRRADVNVPKDYTMESVKKATLWNIHSFYGWLAENDDPVIITEGFKACMWVWQAGYKPTIALIGSYLSREHSEILARTTSSVVLFLDNNEAGHTGTHKAVAALARRGLTNVTVARYPDEREQPDDLEPEELTAAVRRPLRYTDWRKQL